MSFYLGLKQRLDQVHQWPSTYQFKFIVAQDKKEELYALLPNGKIEEKLSRTGKYLSVTLQVNMQSSEEVIKVYQNLSSIEGIISL